MPLRYIQENGEEDEILIYLHYIRFCLSWQDTNLKQARKDLIKAREKVLCEGRTGGIPCVPRQSCQDRGLWMANAWETFSAARINK